MTILEFLLRRFDIFSLFSIQFDSLQFLYVKEPVLNSKGQRVSKSYYLNSTNQEVVRIVYGRIYDNVTFNGITLTEQFVGMSKRIIYMKPDGTERTSKSGKSYMFNLYPVFAGDGSETLVGFSSPKQCSILKQERVAADEFMQSQNPGIYALLYSHFSDLYREYLKTGISTAFKAALNSVSDVELNAVLDRMVYGTDDKTIRDLIIENLQ